eukprot:47069_3
MDSDGDDDPRSGASKYSSKVNNEVRRSGKIGKGGSASRLAPQGTPQRMNHNAAPSQLAELEDVFPDAGGAPNELEDFLRQESSRGSPKQQRQAQARGGDGSDGGALSLHKKRGAKVQEDFRGRPVREKAPTGFGAGGLPSKIGGVTDIERELEANARKNAEETALAQELLRRQGEFEKNASDKMNSFVDRHGFSWYHVLMVLVINNIIVVILGATVSSGIMSASYSPLGVVQADSVHAVQSGEQNVMVESIHGSSALTVRSHESKTSRMVLEEGPDGLDGFTVSSQGYLRAGTGRALRLLPSPTEDLRLEPTAGGVVDCRADLEVTGSVQVAGSMSAGTVMNIDNDTNTVYVGGFAGEKANLAVSGAITAQGYVELTDPEMGLSVAGSTDLNGGANVGGNMVIMGRLSVFPENVAGPGRRRLAGSNFGEEEELMRIEADGAIYTESNLTVRNYAVLQDTDVFGLAKFNGNMIFGDSPGDTVDAYGTTNFHADVNVGDDSTDSLTVAGSTTFYSTVRIDDHVTMNGDVRFPVASAKLEIASTLTVTGAASLTGGVTIGGGPGTTTAFTSNVNVGPSENDLKLTIESATGNMETKGDLTIQGDSTLEKLDVNGQADFNAASNFHGALTADQGLTVEGLTTLKNNLAVEGSANMRGSVVVQGPGTSFQAMHDVVIGTNQFDDLKVKAVSTFEENVEMRQGLIVGSATNPDDFRIRSDVVVQGPDGGTKLTVDVETGDFHTVGDLSTDGMSTVQDITVNGHATLGTNTVIGASKQNTLRVLATASFAGPTMLGEAASHLVTAWGRAEFNEAVTAKRTFFAQGDSVLGDTGSDLLTINAQATFKNQLTATGHVNLGDSVQDTIVIKGLVAVRDASGTNTLTIQPNTGSLAMNGALTVGGDATLNSAVSLGTNPSHTITVRGSASFSSAVTLGDDSIDLITVTGSSLFKSAVTLATAATLTVEGDVTLGATDGTTSLSIQAPMTIERAMNVNGNMKVDGTMSTYSTLSVKNALHAPVITMQPSGDLTATGTVTAASGVFQSLTATGPTRLDGGMKVGDENAANPGLTHGFYVYGHSKMHGNLAIGGELDVAGKAQFDGDVVVQQDNSFTSTGAVTLGTTTVNGVTTCESTATFKASVELGDSSDNDLITINGRLEVKENGQTMLTVNPANILNYPAPGQNVVAGITVNGDLTVGGASDVQAIDVHGAAVFDADVTLGSDASDEITVRGDLTALADTVFGSGAVGSAVTTLDVHSQSIFHRAVDMRDHLVVGPFQNGENFQFTVNSVSKFNNPVTIDGDTSITGVTTVFGSVDMYTASNGGDLTVRMRSADGYLFASGDMTIEGSTTIGNDASDSLLLTGRFQVGSGIQGEPLTFNANPETGFINLNADKFAVTAETVINHNFFIKDSVGSTMFRVQASTGNTWVEGDLSVTGELITADKPLKVGTLYADTIVGGDPESGVTVEGVQFRGGGFRIAKTDAITELTNGAGTSVEGVQFKNGAIVLGSQTKRDTGDVHFPQIGTANYPKGEHQLATIINSAHGPDMDGTVTSVVFRQYYQHTQGECAPGQTNCGHFAADAGKIKFGTESDWSEVHTTHDAYISLETVLQGTLLERARIAANGDISFTQSRFFFEAATGNTDINGHLTVGNVAGQRRMTITSTDDDSSLEIKSARGSGKSARMLIDGDYAEMRMVSKESADSRLSLMDELEDGYAWTRTGTTNVLALDRVQRGTGDTITVNAGATLVQAKNDNDFATIKVGDHILVNIGCTDGLLKTCVFGEVVSRKVTAVNLAQSPDQLTVEAAFHATTILTDRPYYVSRRITTVTDADTMTFGGVTGAKSFSISSTDSSSSLKVKASQDRNKASVRVTGDHDAEVSLVAGLNKDARLELEEQGDCTADANGVETCINGRGYTMWRGQGAANKMHMFRTRVAAETVDVTAGSANLLLTNGDGPGDVKAGDYIIMDIEGAEQILKVSAIDTLSGGADKIVMELPFTLVAASLTAHPFKVARPIMSANDDDNVVFGDTGGAKQMALKSLDNAAEYIVQAVGALHESKVTVTSDSNSAVELQSGSNDASRIKMRDKTNDVGYTISRSYHQYTDADANTITNNNVLAFDNTIAGPGGTISLERGTKDVISSGALFGSLKVGHHIIIVREGVEHVRKIMQIKVNDVDLTTAGKHELVIDSVISNTFDIVDAAYSIGQRVVEFTTKDDMIIGGNSGAKTLQFASTDNKATLSIEAKADKHEALLDMSGDDAVALAMTAGSAKDARIALRDADKKGYRFTRTGTDNDLYLHRTSPGPGLTASVTKNTVTVTAANAGDFTADVNAVRAGDNIIIFVTCTDGLDCGTEQSREVMSIAVNGNTLDVATPFSTDTDITAATFEVGRKILTVDQQDSLAFGASGGDKRLIVDSSDSNAMLEVKSHATDSIAKVDVNGNVALVDIHSGTGKNTNLKMRDHDTGAGYLFSRDGRPKSCNLDSDPCTGFTPGNADSCTNAGNCIYTAPTPQVAESCINACNSFSLRRTLTGTGTASCAAGSTTVTAVAAVFGSVKVSDTITMLINGVETTRVVTAVASTSSLTIDAAFSASVALSNVAYIVERPVISMPNVDTVNIGGSSGSKQLMIASTDAAAAFNVISRGAEFEASMRVESESRASAVVQAGSDEDAVLQLVSTTPRANGFAFTRGAGSANRLFLDRTSEGPMSTITVNANSPTVQAFDDGAFDQVRIGDRLVVHVNGVEYSQLVTAVCLTGTGVFSATCEPDELTLGAPLHPTENLVQYPYQLYKTVMTVEDDDNIILFGNRGCGAKPSVACSTRSLQVKSTDSSSTMTISSAGTKNSAQLDIKANNDYANLKLQANADKDARLYLTDDADTGFMWRKAKGSTTALSGSTLASSANALTLERTVALARTGARLSSSGGTTKCEAKSIDGQSATNDFNNVRNGDFITVIWNGVEIQRMVTQLTLQIGVVDVDAPFSATLGEDIVDAEYFVTRPLIAFDDYHSVLIGGTMSAALVNIVSSHDSATLKVEASDSPVGQADSTDQKGHAEIQIKSDSVSTMGVYAGSSQDARLKLKDVVNNKGYMMTRLDSQNEINKFINFRSTSGPGTYMNCQAGSTTVTGSGSVPNHLEEVYAGDYIMTVVAGVEVIRKVTAVDKSAVQDTMTIDRVFSTTVAVNSQTYDLLRPVVTFADDNSFLFGGTTGAKTFTVESTDDGAEMKIARQGRRQPRRLQDRGRRRDRRRLDGGHGGGRASQAPRRGQGLRGHPRRHERQVHDRPVGRGALQRHAGQPAGRLHYRGLQQRRDEWCQHFQQHQRRRPDRGRLQRCRAHAHRHVQGYDRHRRSGRRRRLPRHHPHRQRPFPSRAPPPPPPTRPSL